MIPENIYKHPFQKVLGTFSFFFFQQNNLLKMWVCLYLFVPISMYNCFYMIEIIRAARSGIPATELTFLFLHMYLYSKPTTYPEFGNPSIILNPLYILGSWLKLPRQWSPPPKEKMSIVFLKKNFLFYLLQMQKISCHFMLKKIPGNLKNDLFWENILVTGSIHKAKN